LSSGIQNSANVYRQHRLSRTILSTFVPRANCMPSRRRNDKSPCKRSPSATNAVGLDGGIQPSLLVIQGGPFIAVLPVARCSRMLALAAREPLILPHSDPRQRYNILSCCEDGVRLILLPSLNGDPEIWILGVNIVACLITISSPRRKS